VKQNKKIHPLDNQRKEENIKGVKKDDFQNQKRKNKRTNKMNDVFSLKKNTQFETMKYLKVKTLKIVFHELFVFNYVPKHHQDSMTAC